MNRSIRTLLLLVLALTIPRTALAQEVRHPRIRSMEPELLAGVADGAIASVTMRQLVDRLNTHPNPQRGSRARCVMTTFDPETMSQDSEVLRELDADPHGPAYVTALVGADGQKKLNGMTMSYENSADTQLFQLNAAMSSPGKAWTDADSFWTPKVALPKKPQ